MSDAQTGNSQKAFSLEKLTAGDEARREHAEGSAPDAALVKKFFRPTIFNLSDVQESSRAPC